MSRSYRKVAKFPVCCVGHKGIKEWKKNSRRASTKNGIKPLKKQFNEEIKDYDPVYEAFCAAYGDDNY